MSNVEAFLQNMRFQGGAMMGMILPKKSMTEEDIKLQYITPAVTSKWSRGKITMETPITDGKINLFTSRITCEMKERCWGSFSTEITRSQPRETSSILMLPVPAKRSKAVNESKKKGKAIKINKSKYLPTAS